MKWYWILLIGLAMFAIGFAVAKSVKPKGASSPATATDPLAGKPNVSTTVTKSGNTETVTQQNGDGTKTIAVARTS